MNYQWIRVGEKRVCLQTGNSYEPVRPDHYHDGYHIYYYNANKFPNCVKCESEEHLMETLKAFDIAVGLIFKSYQNK